MAKVPRNLSMKETVSTYELKKLRFTSKELRFEMMKTMTHKRPHNNVIIKRWTKELKGFDYRF
jgi:hypothetical protein